MNLDHYNRSYEEVVVAFEEEADARLREMRRKCTQGFIEKINNRQRQWDELFRDLLNKSQEIITPTKSQPLVHHKPTQENPPSAFGVSGESLFSTTGALSFQSLSADLQTSQPNQTSETTVPETKKETEKADTQKIQEQATETTKEHQKSTTTGIQISDPYFNNTTCIKEFIRLQKGLEQNREALNEINTQPHLKEFKVNLYRFIRTQINTITNDDPEHLENKIKMLNNLLAGRRIIFQDQVIEASQHPQGQLYCLESTSETFVTVGKKLIDAKPAYAKSIATVVKGIVDNNNLILTDLIIGHLQERCPYLVPMYPNIDDIPKGDDQEYKYKIACGYSYDFRAKALESDEKYYLSMRSMSLLYGNLLVQLHIERAWTWLASFLNLRPEPVISALILQAFLQEASKELSKVYGRQYKKLVSFIRNDYVKLLEELTKMEQRQSLEKLKNLLEADSNLFASPSVSSIFGVVRLA